MSANGIIMVGVGGFFGAVARYVIGLVIAEKWGSAWPYGTFVINITGCFMIGFFLTLAAERFAIGENWRLVFPVGFVGAYTTFSTFEYETVRLIESGAWARALTYVALSTITGFAAVLLAVWTARRF